MMSALPNMSIIAPCDPADDRAADARVHRSSWPSSSPARQGGRTRSDSAGSGPVYFGRSAASKKGRTFACFPMVRSLRWPWI